jgi:hypothetical protein
MKMQEYWDVYEIIDIDRYNVEIFSEEYNITQYYKYHEYGYVAKYYRNMEIYGRYANAIYIISDYNDRETK